MKYSNAYSYKLAIVATSLVMVYFASGIASIAQASELVKTKPVQQVELIEAAKSSLKLSFSTLTINNDFNTVNTISNTESAMTNQKNSVNKDQVISLTKATLISE